MLAVRLSWCAAALAAALCFAVWPTVGHAYTAEEQQACSPDAFRLCGSEIPDIDRVTACMVRKQSQLSPECRKFFRPSPQAAASGKPNSITPVAARTSKSKSKSKAKSKKAAKPAAT